MKRISRRRRLAAAATFEAWLVMLAWSGSSSDADAGDRGPVVTQSSNDDSATRDSRSSADASTDAALPPLRYSNPRLARDFPDPFVLTGANAYYAFATNGNGKNVQAITSADLVAWTDLPDALPVLPSWAAKDAGLTWAPSVLARGNGYVMYYTARYVASGFQCISRAVSATPEGPYVDTSTRPFLCQIAPPEPYCGSIDPSPFVDADGAAYLLWKSDENASPCATPPRLWSAPLAADGLSLAGPAKAMLTMDASWEQPILEGPTMAVHAGVYFLFYSANAYESASYSMGYGTCLTASGPCTKATLAAPFIKSAGTALGAGGGEIFTDRGGREWLAYHAWTAPKTTYAAGGARSLRIDPIAFDGAVPSFDGPSTTTRASPSMTENRRRAREIASATIPFRATAASAATTGQ